MDYLSDRFTTKIPFTTRCSLTKYTWGSSAWSFWAGLKRQWQPSSLPQGPPGRALQDNPTLKEFALFAAPTPTFFPGPPRLRPCLGHQAKRIHTLKATPGIIKMTNWRIETIYAFVYLKILPLFIETRKMGTVRQERAWEGWAWASACVLSLCWIK